MRDKRREELEAQARVIVDKMQLVTSQTAIKYMEEDLSANQRFRGSQRRARDARRRRYGDNLDIYQILYGTPVNEKIPEVNELFKLVLSGTSSLVRRAGLEPARP